MSMHIAWALLAAALAAANYLLFDGLTKSQATVQTYKKMVADQKAQAKTKFDDQVAKTKAAEQALAAFKAQQEKDDETNKKVVSDLTERLRLAGGAHGRLRDPNATGRGCGGAGTPGATPAAPPGGAGNKAEADGLLSAQLTGLLRRLQHEADLINNAYASCRGTALNDRGQATD